MVRYQTEAQDHINRLDLMCFRKITRLQEKIFLDLLKSNMIIKFATQNNKEEGK